MALFQHVGRVNSMRHFIHGEEGTKQTLIMPLIAALGYDIYNPREVRMEFSIESYHDKKVKEKVDYAIFNEIDPIFFIEAKPVGEPLMGHTFQMARYFNLSPLVKFAILTNGIEYLFFTDNDIPNLLDRSPFHKLNIENLSKFDVEFLSYFARSRFNEQHLKVVSRTLTTPVPEPEFIPGQTTVYIPPLVHKSVGRPKVLDTKRFTVTIDRGTFDEFHEYAEEHSINRSMVVRDLLRQWLNEQQKDSSF